MLFQNYQEPGGRFPGFFIIQRRGNLDVTILAGGLVIQHLH